MKKTIEVNIDLDALRHQKELVSSIIDYPPDGYDHYDLDHLEGLCRLLESIERSLTR